MPNDGGSNGACDMVVACSDVGNQGSEGVEGGFIAVQQFASHIFGNHVHGDVPWTFYHDLHVIARSNAIEFS